MRNITINGEPFRYKRNENRVVMFTTIYHTGCVVVEPGEYILIDRHFNTFILTEKQMDYYIQDDYARFQRAQTKGEPNGKPST